MKAAFYPTAAPIPGLILVLASASGQTTSPNCAGSCSQLSVGATHFKNRSHFQCL